MTPRVVGGSTYNLAYDPENRLVGVSGAVTKTSYLTLRNRLFPVCSTPRCD